MLALKVNYRSFRHSVPFLADRHPIVLLSVVDARKLTAPDREDAVVVFTLVIDDGFTGQSPVIALCFPGSWEGLATGNLTRSFRDVQRIQVSKAGSI